MGLEHNGAWTQRDWDTTGWDTRGLGYRGLGHNGTGTQGVWDTTGWDTRGLGHNGTGTQRDWDTTGWDTTGWDTTGWDTRGLGHNGTGTQRAKPLRCRYVDEVCLLRQRSDVAVATAGSGLPITRATSPTRNVTNNIPGEKKNGRKWPTCLASELKQSKD